MFILYICFVFFLFSISLIDLKFLKFLYFIFGVKGYFFDLYMIKNLNKISIIMLIGIDLISNLWLVFFRVILVCKVGYVINSFESYVFICSKKNCFNICILL